MAAVFVDLGYVQRGRLDFEAKKLTALWFAPPLTHPPLPRIFISELLVDQLSAEAQVGRGTHTTRQRGASGHEGVVVD